MKKYIAHFLRNVRAITAAIVGHISWESPRWLTKLRSIAKSHPRGAQSFMISVCAFMVMLSFFYQWYSHLPKSPLIVAQVIAPETTPLTKVLTPTPLTIEFIDQATKTPRAVAPLQSLYKEVTQGIQIYPDIKGKWLWQSDNRLIFTPTVDWPAGQTFTVSVDKHFFALGKNKMQKMSYTFHTQPFKAMIQSFKFYQNPIDPKQHQAIATIQFNYAVDPQSFERNTSINLKAIKDHQTMTVTRFPFSVEYDEHKRVAYIHSNNLPLSQAGSFLRLSLSKGIKAQSATSSTTEEITSDVYIPDASEYFKIDKVSTQIVRNERDVPEQVLTIESSLGISANKLNPAIHAYLLPKDYPATKFEAEKENYQWQNPGEVTADILKLATPINLQPIPADRDYATLHNYKFNTATPRYVYLKIDKGIASLGEYTLANDYVAVMAAPAFPNEINFSHKGALLALSGEKKLSVSVRGLPAVKFKIARVLPENLNQLITQSYGDFNNPQFLNYSFNQDNISEIFSEIQTFDMTDPGKAQYSALDLKRYLTTETNVEGPQGLFLLEANGWDPIKKELLPTKTTQLILITDLGLVVKDNHDGSHDVFVQSITKGSPVNQVSISVLGKNGLSIASASTDIQGHAHFESLNDFIDEKAPTSYVATLNSDVSFIPYNKADRQLNYSRFDIGGLYTNQDLQSLSAYIFSDRGLYRPGDTAHIAMIVKRAYAKAEVSGMPLEIIVSDPRGNTIQDQKVLLDESGFMSFDIKTLPSSATGQYTINLHIVKDNHADSLLGSTTIRVAEFLPDRMRIETHLSQPLSLGWLSPKDLKADVQLMNLYGAPATDRRISAKIILKPKIINFTQYPNYIFFDPLLDPTKPPKIFSDTLTDGKTNDSGQAQFDLDLLRFDKATYELSFFAEGFEAEGGRSVTAQTTALISPVNYLIGYKADGDLKYIKQDSERKIDFIAINPELKKQALNNLKIQLLQFTQVSTLVKNSDSTYQYQSVEQSNILSTQPFIINADKTPFTLATDKIGDFAYVIIDEQNSEVSRIKYSVVGESQLPIAKDATLSVKLNKNTYLADEDIELQITAPYTGAGLITIERDKVYAMQWFKTDNTSSLQKIRIPKDFQGNGYVNISFIRDWNSPDIYMSPLSYSIMPFSIKYSDRAINVDLDVPPLARPGENLIINYKSDKPGKIIVFAVDEGILQVADYKIPDPLNFFFQKKALEVTTQQTLDQILPQFRFDHELSNVGGDTGNTSLLNHLNPFKRKTELPVVFWSGIIDTDSEPHQLTYRIPDYFNGSLRVMAVAVTNDAVGAASEKLEVHGDFVINPNVPTFVAPNDEFEITASIANNAKGSGDHASINVGLNASTQLEIISASHQTLEISEGHEKVVKFKLKAKAELGSAQLSFVVDNEKHMTKMGATLSVRPASPYLTTIQSGFSKQTELSLPITRSLYPEYRDVNAVASSSPLILTSGLQQYLDNFPYGCTEQLVSKTFPLLAMQNNPLFANRETEIKEKVNNMIQQVIQRQMSNGGFSYWPQVTANTDQAFASVYTIHFLTDAHEYGYDIPNDVMRNALRYLMQLAEQNSNNMDEARLKAYAIYLLTRNEIVTTNYLTNLQLYLEQNQSNNWRSDITAAYIASTYSLLKNVNEANRLISSFVQTKNDRSSIIIESNDFYSKPIANAIYLYLVARHFPEHLTNSDSEARVMSLVDALSTNEINTLFSSYTSLALDAFAKNNAVSNNYALSIHEIFANQHQKNLSLNNNLSQLAKINDGATHVNFKNPEKGTFFYQLSQSGFDRGVVSDVIKNGLEIEREYHDLNHQIIETTTLGSEIEVHIKLRALDNKSIHHLAIVDLLPGGFEVVPNTIDSSAFEYVDVREDRVIFFSDAFPETKEIVYRIKATNTGRYRIPQIQISSMYKPSLNAQNKAQGMFTVMP